jgi:hypothetical protein
MSSMRHFIASLIALCFLALPAVGELKLDLVDEVISPAAEHREAWYAGGQLQSNFDNLHYDPRILAVSCASDATDLTTYTFAGLDMGAIYPDRRTTILVGGFDSAVTFSVSTVTVGGDSATEVIDEDGTGLTNTAIYDFANVAGTSESVVVTFNEAVTGAAVCAISTTGVSSAISTTAANDVAAAALNLNVNTKNGGFTLAVCVAETGSTQTPTGGLTLLA